MESQSQVGAELPRYRCHKEVWALKIKSVDLIFWRACGYRVGLTMCGYAPDACVHEGSALPEPPWGRHKYEPTQDPSYGAFATGEKIITPEDERYAPFKVSKEYVEKHNPQAGGYYVVYKDGYKSFSPAEAFEEGYTKL
jgi:hypothetical protein